MRGLGVLATLAALAAAAPEDDTHPRSPGTPLEIRYAPWFCPACLKEGRIEAEPRTLHVLRTPAPDLARRLGVRKWHVVETPNFVLFSTLGAVRLPLKSGRFLRADLARLKTIFPKLKPSRDGVKLTAHQRLHLYHLRAERIYSHFAALTDNRKPFLGMGARYQMLLFADKGEHHVVADEMFGHPHRKGGLRFHDKRRPNFLAWSGAESLMTGSPGTREAKLANLFAHGLGHNLLDGHLNFYREAWGWLEEGMGHYYERRENPEYNTFCTSEGSPPAEYLKPDWTKAIRHLVRRERDPPLNGWCERLQPGDLTPVENLLSWGIVKWLVETDPVRFTKLLHRMEDYKNAPSCAQCIKDAFGVSPSVLHQRWREHVLATR